jgi:hypothetical protein
MVFDHNIRRDDRVVEGNGLENRRAGNRTVGSNPTLSAKEKPEQSALVFPWLKNIRCLYPVPLNGVCPDFMINTLSWHAADDGKGEADTYMCHPDGDVAGKHKDKPGYTEDDAGDRKNVRHSNS